MAQCSTRYKAKGVQATVTLWILGRFPSLWSFFGIGNAKPVALNKQSAEEKHITLDKSFYFNYLTMTMQKRK